MLNGLKRLVRERGLEGAAAVLPASLIRRLVSRATANFDIALCLHRVEAPGRDDMLMPELAHAPEQIDELLEYFGGHPERLTLTFDDGYDDARQYIQSRASQHPDVSWRFMVCPQKTIERHSFTWDDWMLDGQNGDPMEFIADWEVATRAGESRAGGVATRAELGPYRLSTIDECLEVAELPNVELGDHTDNHYAMAWLSPEQVDQEILDSRSRFEAAFGEHRHFAFPFGAEPHVAPHHIERAAELTDATVWTIDSRPFPVAQREVTPVRPRFAWYSTGPSPKAMALFVALKCVAARRS